ncbi:Oligoketide cyclase/lipid transport protein [Handroanthus impetiginosus]|uniref:Oligoketide cyclase/lipid transport protein n=1 Tax=Handroanthus impetiginosus TaxID=429701 RepID=A0A2G9HFZ5_9LAMI|nr:Oligoketide cyclase/lipid transport protein [Handroanthus impetiginosus]
MPPFNPASRALARSVFRRDLFRQQTKSCSNYNQIRCSTGIAGNNVLCSADKIVTGGYGKSNFQNCENSSNISNIFFQKRGFLGCSDGEEGNMLAKVYEERRLLGYSPEQLFNVVAAVDMYEDFLPWCQRSQIIRRNPDGSFDAELEIGFKFLVESYISHVELTKPKSIKTTSSQSSLFDHLINIWEFSPGPVPGTCNLHFLVDFKFQSPFYRQIANMFFKEVVSRLVSSFNDRCRLIYGPEVPVLENTYDQRA